MRCWLILYIYWFYSSLSVKSSGFQSSILSKTRDLCFSEKSTALTANPSETLKPDVRRQRNLTTRRVIANRSYCDSACSSYAWLIFLLRLLSTSLILSPQYLNSITISTHKSQQISGGGNYWNGFEGMYKEVATFFVKNWPQQKEFYLFLLAGTALAGISF